MLNAFAPIGLPGCGKGTLANLITTLADAPRGRIIIAQMSEILDWRAGFNDKTSREIRTILNYKAEGRLFPNQLVLTAFSDWLKSKRNVHPDLNLVILDGIPRADGQVTVFNFFNEVRVLQIRCSDTTASQAIEKRARKEGASRTDNNPETIAKRLAEHKEREADLFGSIDPRIIRTVDRDKQSLEEILSAAVSHLPVRPGISKKMRNRLADPCHPIHDMIRTIVKPAPEAMLSNGHSPTAHSIKEQVEEQPIMARPSPIPVAFFQPSEESHATPMSSMRPSGH